MQHGTVFTVHDTDRPIVSDSRIGIVLRTVCENNTFPLLMLCKLHTVPDNYLPLYVNHDINTGLL